MPRYRLTIEYDGTPFVGWQAQAEGASVQAKLITAIKAFSGENVALRGAGRTDAGVHAIGQVAHFDLGKRWDPFRIREALNYHLRPLPVCILEAVETDGDFDARISAIMRHYIYRILDRRPPTVLRRDRVWWIPKKLDCRAMHDAAQSLVGHHDFTTFRAAACQAKSPVKTLDRIEVVRDGDEIVVLASARSFLHNQVRSMVGSLKHVGESKWKVHDIAKALAAKDRKACGTVAPPQGLYLSKVDYPDPATRSQSKDISDRLSD